MYRFPTEILLLIFRFACVDGGETGCSLALVSKHFREISRESRFQCVAAYEDKFPQLAAILEQTAPEHRRVKHIFLATRREKPRTTPTGERASLAMYYTVEGYHTMYDAYSRILTAVHSSLESIYVYHSLAAARRYLFLPSSSTSLVSMSMYGLCPLFYDPVENCPELPIYPSLRYLDMSGFGDYPPDFFERIALQTPNITSLFLKPLKSPHHLHSDVESALQQQQPPLEKQRAFGGRRYRALLNNTETSAAKLPSSIERVYIEKAQDAKPLGWPGTEGHYTSTIQPCQDARLRVNSGAAPAAPTDMEPDPEAARQRWVDAQGAKAYLPMLTLYKAPMVQAEILTSTTVTYHRED